MCGEVAGKLQGEDVVFIGKARVLTIKWTDYLEATAGNVYDWSVYSE
jgi:hypothetical protein